MNSSLFVKQTKRRFLGRRARQEMDANKKVARIVEVSRPWVTHIYSGRKTVEVRKNDPTNWGSVKAGEELWIQDTVKRESRLFRVVETRTYPGIGECIIAEGVRNLLPGEQTLQRAREIYLGFDGTSPEAMAKREAEFAKYGSIAIQLEPVVPSAVNSQTQSGENKTSRYSQMGICAVPLGDIDDYVFDVDPDEMRPVPLEGNWTSGKPAGIVKSGYIKDVSDPELLAHHSRAQEMTKALDAHVKGSCDPSGDPNCDHFWDNEVTAQEYNDETMGGCGSGWTSRCNRCGKVWYDQPNM